MAAKTSDGYVWTPQDGVVKGGLVCRGVISPPVSLRAVAGHIYDVIVVGAGYAGLAAAREVAARGECFAVAPALRLVVSRVD